MEIKQQVKHNITNKPMEVAENFDWIKCPKSLEMKFCKTQCRKLVDKGYNDFFRDMTHKLLTSSMNPKEKDAFERRSGDGFPGCLAPFILRSQFERIKQMGNHKVLPKSDGIRSMLIFQTIGEEYCCCLVNRSNSYQMIKMDGFLPAVYEGTFLDGELTELDGKFVFQVFDCLMFAGKLIVSQTHPERLSCANISIQNITPQFETNNPFSIIIKSYISHEKMEKWISWVMDPESIENEDFYPIDGFILIDLKSPYVFGRADTECVKWKWSHTVDFQLIVEKDKKTGRFTVGNENKTIQKTVLSAEVFNLMNDHLVTICNQSGLYDLLDGSIIECKWDATSKKWEPILRRYDKLIPNSSNTFDLTLKNKEEDIQFHEIIALVDEETSFSDGDDEEGQ